MGVFNLTTSKTPKGDQGQAIKKLSEGLEKGFKEQTLLGVTGSGKTFTMANVIQNTGRPALIISHNKTLAAQLYNEFRELFPENAVEYFVSYYDFYQPEAYMPATDTYIAKEVDINQEIERLRQKATMSLSSRKDVIVIASVSCIYGLGLPQDYIDLSQEFYREQELTRKELMISLLNMQYQRNDTAPDSGDFRARGEVVDVWLSYIRRFIRFIFKGKKISEILEVDPLTMKEKSLERVTIYPSKHYVLSQKRLEDAMTKIREEMRERINHFKREGRELEAKRLEQRTLYDLELMREMGYCPGIENYAMHLTGRKPGEPPSTLIDYFPDDFVCFIDESHVTVPQLRGMYEGNLSRKRQLIDGGFRLPSAYENRPLKFSEFQEKINQVVYVSATPNDWELERSERVAEQIIRPTGLIDPEVEVRPQKEQMDEILSEIRERVEKKERTLLITLTKRMAENVSGYLLEKGIKTRYMHADIPTLERSEIIRELRMGKFDVLVGVNLLREGLDLPEVSLIIILDADKEGFLRSETSLIQMIGRASRNRAGKVILFGDEITNSMSKAMEVTNKRRKNQIEYNKKHNITPKTIKRKIEKRLVEKEEAEKEEVNLDEMVLDELEYEMEKAASALDFEQAAIFRDRIRELKEKNRQEAD